jgi:hypothetical protein
MDPIAVEHSRARLRKAKKALGDLRTADSFESAEDAWSDFLLAGSSIYSKLEQGSKSFGISTAWYGIKKRERRRDQLLRYLHFARNSDEHGIERVVTRYADTGPIWGRQPKYGERIPVTIQQLDSDTNEPFGEATEGFYSGSTIKLVRITDRRFGDFCDPPKAHLGKSIPYYEEPLDIAELGFAYLEALISEAERLVGGATKNAG